MRMYKVLIIISVVSFMMISCTPNIHQETNETYDHDITEIHPATQEETATITQTTEDCGEDNILQQIKNKVGFPFRVRCAEGQELYCVYIYDTYAKRVVLRKTNDGDTTQDNLKWEVSNNQLSISGEWNEIFSIDIATNTAISNSDGKVYRICPEHS